MDEAPDRSNIPIPDPSLLTITALDREITHLRELMVTQLDARALLTDEKIAAAKEAVSKAEAAPTTQLDGLRANLETEIRAMREQIEDVKKNAMQGNVRAGQAEGRGAGKEYMWGMVLVVAAVLISALSIILTR